MSEGKDCVLAFISGAKFGFWLFLFISMVYGFSVLERRIEALEKSTIVRER